MNARRFVYAAVLATVMGSNLAACGGGGSGPSSPPAPAVADVKQNPTPIPIPIPIPISTLSPSPLSPALSTGPALTTRAGFVGAFFRPQGLPAFGIFSAGSPQVAPQPYPGAGTPGYCNAVAANGYSIESGNLIDRTKLADITNLGVGWTRMPAPQFSDDGSHILGAGHYSFGDFDSAQCNTLVDHGIVPVVNLEAGPVEYNATPGQLSPQQVALYQSAADFGQWCGVVAAHERSAFPTVTKFSLPGNEVNSNPQLFPGGVAQIAAYSQACYAAIKAANPAAFVYAFELNMDGALNAPGFVRQLYALGCKPGTCYDGISMHLSLRYPVPAAGTPCYPNPGGDYGMQCVTDIQTAAGSPVHVLISESVYPVPASIPDEATKALAIVASFNAYAANAVVDGVSYANVDECALYPSGFFAGGCIVSTSGALLPGYTALQQLAAGHFPR